MEASFYTSKAAMTQSQKCVERQSKTEWRIQLLSPTPSSVFSAYLTKSYGLKMNSKFIGKIKIRCQQSKRHIGCDNQNPYDPIKTFKKT